MTSALRWVLLALLCSASLVAAQSEKTIMHIYQQGYEAYQQGNYQDALIAYERSLKLARQEKFRQGMVINLSSLGFLYGVLGQYDKALLHLEEGLKLARELKLSHEIAVCLNSLGGVYFFSSQYDKALEHFEEAIKVPQGLTTPSEVAAHHNNLGVVYGSLGNYPTALEHFEEALRLRKQLKKAEDIAATLNNLATLYLFQQRYPEAERTSREADAVQQTTRIPWRGRAVLSEVYLATQRYAAALALLQESTPAWHESDDYRVLFHTQHGLALHGSGRLPEASQALVKAVSLAEDLRQRTPDRLAFFGVDPQGGRLRPYRALVATLAERALQGEQHDPAFAPYGQSLASAALYFSEATKARVLLESMAAAARQTTKIALPPDIRAEENALLAELAALHERWGEAYQRGEAALQSFVERKQRLTQTLQTLTARLRREYPRYAALHYPQPVPLDALPLKAQEVLLEYAVGEEATYLFRVSNQRLDKIWRINVRKDDLERQVRSFLEPLQQESGSARGLFAPTQGHNLYRLLMAEALQGIAPGTKVLIVPDGVLGVLPFEALVVTPGTDVKTSRFLGETWQFSYYQSASVLAFLRTLPPSAAPKPLFALGHPVYDQQDPRYVAYQQRLPAPVLQAQALSAYAYRGRATPRAGARTARGEESGAIVSYPPLPETASEVKTIAQLFQTPLRPPDVLLDVSANETQLRQSPLSHYRYLHFATHADLPGKLQGINEPFLLLGQVENLAKDDGVLTLSKVLDMRLDADLVVLSACVTGRGQALEGEGVMNFARAFHQAGARSVVVSLWEVASNETADYMTRFYRYLQAGKSKTEALALARKEIKSLYPHPFFWAAFILHGEG